MNNSVVIVDTGPLVAFLSGKETTSEWVKAQFEQFEAPFLTCEPVLVETFFLISRTSNGRRRFFELLASGLLEFNFLILAEHERLAELLEKYRDLPMSLADGCLVHMAEMNPNSAILTLDTHFKIYRKNNRQPIPLIAPWI